MNADQPVTHFAPSEQRKQQQNVMCGYVSPGDNVTTDSAAVTCKDCRDWIGPTEPPPAFKLEDPASPSRPQNMVDPSVPPPRSATLEEIAEVTKHVPRRPRAMLDVGFPLRGYQVSAIAASLAAEFPGMFAGDVLRPLPPLPLEGVFIPASDSAYSIRMREHLESLSRPQPPVIDVIREPDLPPLKKLPGHRKGYRVGLTTKGGGKPPGSKLARKAAKGKL